MNPCSVALPETDFAMYGSKKIHVLATLIVAGLARRRVKADDETMRRLDFRTGTQRLPLRFGAKLRNAWRARWLRIRR